MTALDIINQARERLGDIKKQRWTDNRLLAIVSQGQVDICVESGYLRREVILPFGIGQTRFQLPVDCYTIKRVEYDGAKLPLFTRNDQDDLRVPTAEFTAYKSNLNMDRIEVQPAVTELVGNIAYAKGEKLDQDTYINPIYGVVVSSSTPVITVEPLYGSVVGGELLYEKNLADLSDGYGEIAGSNTDITVSVFPNSKYGVLTEVEYSQAEVFGFITEVDSVSSDGSKKEHIVSGRYGICTNVSNLKDTFHVYYVATPAKLKFEEAILEMPNMWEDLLIRYTVGTALQDDNDANNIARGEAELQKYNIKLETIKDLSSKDFSSNSSDKYETPYRRV